MKLTRNLNHQNEVHGSEITRVAKMVIIQKWKGYGSLGGGPEYRQLIGLYLRHRFGKIGQHLIIKYEPQYIKLHHFLKAIKTSLIK